MIVKYYSTVWFLYPHSETPEGIVGGENGVAWQGIKSLSCQLWTPSLPSCPSAASYSRYLSYSLLFGNINSFSHWWAFWKKKIIITPVISTRSTSLPLMKRHLLGKKAARVTARQGLATWWISQASPQAPFPFPTAHLFHDWHVTSRCHQQRELEAGTSPG